MSFRFYLDAELPQGEGLTHHTSNGMQERLQSVTQVFNREKQLVAKESVYMDGTLTREYFRDNKCVVCIVVERENGVMQQQIQYEYDENETLLQRVDVTKDGRVFRYTPEALAYCGS